MYFDDDSMIPELRSIVSPELQNGQFIIGITTHNLLYFAVVMMFMGLGDLLPKGPLRQRFGSDTDEITVSDLEDEFGEEVVKRGISYMASLADADEEYRKSVQGSNYVKESLRGFAESPDEVEVSDDAEEANNEWRRNSQEGGLGLDGKRENESDN